MASEQVKCNKCDPTNEFPESFGCVCDLLIEAGNCPGCLNLPEKCECAPKKIVHEHWTEYIPAYLPDYGVIPEGYQAVVHRFRTVIAPVTEPVAFTPYSSE
jgi:hypothetical protein